MAASFRHITAINDQHPIVFAECLVYQALMLGYDGLVLPLPFPDELLHGSHPRLDAFPGPQQLQHHRSGTRLRVILAGHIGLQ